MAGTGCLARRNFHGRWVASTAILAVAALALAADAAASLASVATIASSSAALAFFRAALAAICTSTLLLRLRLLLRLSQIFLNILDVTIAASRTVLTRASRNSSFAPQQ